jgi:putative transposase
MALDKSALLELTEVMEAYVHGVSTRKVDDLVAALGAESGISKSEVSRICAELDTDVAAFNTRDLGQQSYPYVFLDATYCKARVGGDKGGKGARVVSQAVVIATGVSADGRREVLGCAVGTPKHRTSGPISCGPYATADWAGPSW